MHSRRIETVVIVGTRPEAIKMAPVVRALRARSEFAVRLFTTGQHREMLDQALADFELVPDLDLGLMQHGGGLSHFAARCLTAMEEVLSSHRPDVLLVQGDTTTVVSAALAAAYCGVRVGHVEAGLRSHDRAHPFPEEINRRMAGVLADFHFAPTELARQNLLREGTKPEQVFVTGNTVVDALRMIPLDGAFAHPALQQLDFERRRTILVTAHRRENHGENLHAICQAVKQLVRRFPDVQVVFPVHLNPAVQQVARGELSGTARVHLVDPVGYRDLLRLMQRSTLILTDSGGIQEEAPSMRKPVLILREVTERPEVVTSGAGRLVGTDTARIVTEASWLLTDRAAYAAMSQVINPFGDGHAAERIADILAKEITPAERIAA